MELIIYVLIFSKIYQVNFLVQLIYLKASKLQIIMFVKKTFSRKQLTKSSDPAAKATVKKIRRTTVSAFAQFVSWSLEFCIYTVIMASHMMSEDVTLTNSGYVMKASTKST